MSEALPLQDLLHDLLAFEGGGNLVLSAYLNAAPDRQVGRTYRTAFTTLVRQLAADLPDEAQAALEREADRVQTFLEGAPPPSRGLAIFSCTPADFWRVIPVPAVVAESVQLGRRPYLRPLIALLDEYERYAVALVDKERARLFTVHLGRIEEQEQVFDVVPGKHDQGGWSQANYQRHHEAHVYWHLKRVADELSLLLRRQPFDRLVLAGPDEAMSELQRILPRPLRTRVVARLPAELFASTQEILERTLEVERQVERENEERLVAEVLETAQQGGLATYGVWPTLEALWLGRVHLLVVAEGLRRPGSECLACGRIVPDAPPRCPACGEATTALDDVVERAIERALEEAGMVEIVAGAAAGRLSEAGEGMGALLRY